MKEKKAKYITKIEKVEGLDSHEKLELQKVAKRYAFRTNSYYQKLIDWSDPDDPIRRIIIPSFDELERWGDLDISQEHKYTKVPGLEHKYQYTALLLINDVCGGYCRFCFRKRLFMDINDEVVREFSKGIEYIRENPEINNVLLTGGDPLVMSTAKLAKVISALREIDHVRIIRIGSKMPAFNPFRILDDPSLLELFEKYSQDGRRIYLMAHFNHPRELTPEALRAMDLIQRAGVIAVNQTPLLRGVNDNPEVLAELFNRLSYAGVPPYYIFQCRPTAGNKTFAVPIEEGLEIFEQARMKCSGLAKRARYVMSHAVGKIEVLGMTEDLIHFKYLRAANPEEKARFFVCRRNPEAYWLDDYEEFVDEFTLDNPFWISEYSEAY
jgi:lysine 2,3-aminomutase